MMHEKQGKLNKFPPPPQKKNVKKTLRQCDIRQLLRQILFKILACVSLLMIGHV